MDKANLLHLMGQITDDAAAYRYLESVRWNGQPVCPHCGDVGRAYFLTPANGKSRQTSTGAESQRRIWKCAECRQKFSVLTGTVMHGSKISTRVWVLVFFEMAVSKNGVSAREIERKYALTPKSAWFLLHRIRQAMGNDGPVETMTGTIVADETFIGGKIRNKHRQGVRRLPDGGRGRAGRPKDKVAVMTLVNKTTGQARSRVVRDVTGATLAKVLHEQVNVAGSVLHTDAWQGYRGVGREFIDHQFVDHSAFEYVRGDVSTNQAEGFFSQLKRSIDGTHHKVSREHLPRYLAEFDYRYSTRKMTDAERMANMLGQSGGLRLAYRSLKTAS